MQPRATQKAENSRAVQEFNAGGARTQGRPARWGLRRLCLRRAGWSRTRELAGVHGRLQEAPGPAWPGRNPGGLPGGGVGQPAKASGSAGFPVSGRAPRTRRRRRAWCPSPWSAGCSRPVAPRAPRSPCKSHPRPRTTTAAWGRTDTQTGRWARPRLPEHQGRAPRTAVELSQGARGAPRRCQGSGTGASHGALPTRPPRGPVGAAEETRTCCAGGTAQGWARGSPEPPRPRVQAPAPASARAHYGSGEK